MKNSGTTFIIIVALVGLVLGGFILSSPPKTSAPNSDNTSQNSQVKEDPTLISNPDSPIVGKQDAPIKIVVFSDFLCPYCAQLHETINGYLGKYNNISVETRTFLIHSQADVMSRAAYAANKQGKSREAADLIFTKYTDATEDNMVKMAEELKLDTGKFKTDLNSDAAKKSVEKDSSDAEALGLGGTPSVFVNNKYLEDPSQLESKITELSK